MSVEYTKPAENLVARACKITIDKSLSETAYITLEYTNDREKLGKVVITPDEIVDQGILTLEQVQLIEANLKMLANAKSPVVE